MSISEEAEMPEQRETTESAPSSSSESRSAFQPDLDGLRSRLRIRVGDTEVEFEGSESFLEREMPNLLNALIRMERGQEIPSFGRAPVAAVAAAPLMAAQAQAMAPLAAPLAAEGGVVLAEVAAVEPPVLRFAKELGVDLAYLEAGFAPTNAPPWIRLDHHHWATFKQRTPKFGKNAANDVQLTAVALNFWFKHLDRDPPTMEDIRGTVRESGLSTKNAQRSVENCVYLQKRGETVVIKPTEFLRAKRIARAYCLQEVVSGE